MSAKKNRDERNNAAYAEFTAKTPSARPPTADETDLLSQLLTDDEVRLRELARTLPGDARRALVAIADHRADLREVLHANFKATLDEREVRAEQQREAEARRVVAMGADEQDAFKHGQTDRAKGFASIGDSFPFGPLRDAYKNGYAA